MNKININSSMLIVSGDWHGRFDKIVKWIKQHDIRDCSIIQAGDFGIGFKSIQKDLATLKHFNHTLQSRAICVYAIRGNHDNPSWFNGQQIGNITFLQDYTILQWNDKKVLTVGGAVSIDRYPNSYIKLESGKPWPGRKEGRNWWPNEIFIYDQSKIGECNIVVTHSAPNWCQPLVKSGSSMHTWMKCDPTLENDCNQERALHSQLYKDLSQLGHIDSWYYGHFHHSNTEWINDTKFQLLDIYETVEIR